MIKITFPDSSIREYPSGINGIDIAKSLSNSLAREVLSVSVNGNTYDLTRPITEDSEIRFNKWDDREGMHAFWHSSAHLMAEALEALYPGIKFGIGPSIENGFYYDVDPGDNKTITDSDIPSIEKKMKELAALNNPFERKEVPKNEAIEFYTKKGDQYKVELLNDLEDGTISFYTHGNFTDL